MPPDQLVRLLAGLRAVTTGIYDALDRLQRPLCPFDGSLSRFNFLKYDDAQWRPFNSGRQYVNRLRHSDYVRMFREAGFTILEESSVPGEPTAEIVNNVAPQFRKYEGLIREYQPTICSR